MRVETRFDEDQILAEIMPKISNTDEKLCAS